ncbi:hypothetical protein [Stieleria varia]|uniref:Uncharacterized protein n=1 Tax=Stieleria varia TaxID=2528005 RepID=A0A5C6B6T7_9BACT|nr:hypothetical protein [Stieleria varia]TWU07783.1 hypothetical protein Pla52n_03570 [Stieleria varia]
MRFGLPFAIAVLTASAIQMSLIRTHPVWALSLATFLMLTFTLAQRLMRDTTRDGRLIWMGAAVSFIWMMIFGGATIAVGYAYTSVTDTWPDPDEVYIDTPTAVVIFTVMYGGGAAIVGFLAGCFTELGVYLFRRCSVFPNGG